MWVGENALADLAGRPTKYCGTLPLMDIPTKNTFHKTPFFSDFGFTD